MGNNIPGTLWANFPLAPRKGVVVQRGRIGLEGVATSSEMTAAGTSAAPHPVLSSDQFSSGRSATTVFLPVGFKNDRFSYLPATMATGSAGYCKGPKPLNWDCRYLKAKLSQDRRKMMLCGIVGLHGPAVRRSSGPAVQRSGGLLAACHGVLDIDCLPIGFLFEANPQHACP